MQQFSDTFVFYSPLKNANGDISPLPLYGMLIASGMAMILALADGHPVRGAIHIGRGTELAENNFYGPALARVHHIESEVAKYPRVVVSEIAMQFMQANVSFSDSELVNDAQKMPAWTNEN